MDIRDAPAWERLDKALTRIEGRRCPAQAQQGQGGQATAAVGSSGASSTSAASADGWDEEADEEEEGEGEEEPAGGSPEAPGHAASDGGSMVTPGSGGGGRRRLLQGLRQQAARKLRQLANSAASQIKRTQLRLRLTLSLLEGTMAVSLGRPCCPTTWPWVPGAVSLCC